MVIFIHDRSNCVSINQIRIYIQKKMHTQGWGAGNFFFSAPAPAPAHRFFFSVGSGFKSRPELPDQSLHMVLRQSENKIGIPIIHI